ncbi:MAG: trigger factor [Candidatus Uhrbacteria bacterium]
MSESIIENLPKNEVKITITVSVDELRPLLEKSAQDLSEETSIQGFRTGKAPYDVIKNKVGEMKIYEAALDSIVRKTYIEAVTTHELEIAGEPAIKVEKMAPENDLIYTVVVSLMPKIEKLAEWKEMKVDAQPTEVSDKDVELSLKGLAKMQTKETRKTKERSAEKEDKVVIDMNIKKDGVPIEGGQAINNAVFLSEDHYIPGFCDQLMGLKEGDKKNFILKFPNTHYQKHLADQDVEFDIVVKEIYRLEEAELNDQFATVLGMKDLATLKDALRQNMIHEVEHKEKLRQERTMLDMIASKTNFGEISDSLINEEINKMIHELEHSVENQGGVFDDYLKSINKTLGDLKLDFTPEALLRIKVALVIREIAQAEKINVEESEVDQELDSLAEKYQDTEAKKNIYSPANREYISIMIKNRKVIDLLRQTMIK